MLWCTVSSSRKTASALPVLARLAPSTPTKRSKVALAMARESGTGAAIAGMADLLESSDSEKIVVATGPRNSNLPLSNQTTQLQKSSDP